MENILDPAHLPRIAALARLRALVAFDFDGTLSPIVDRPEDAYLPDSTARLLHAVVCRYPVAVISGRSVDDVRARLREVPVTAIIGNHGIEPSAWMAEAAAAVAAWAPAVHEGVAGIEGVEVENKRHSLSIHYRHARSESGVFRAIEETVDRLQGMPRIVAGHKVVNLVPAGAPHKGDALRDLAARADAEAVLFAGDDVTDEDAFAALDLGNSLGIRVCRSERSHARWYIPSQPDIGRLLQALVDARP